MPFNTGNPVPSLDPRDLLDNAVNLDQFANGTQASHPDRRGVARKTLAGMQAEHDTAQVERAGEFDTAQTARASAFDTDQTSRTSAFDADQIDRAGRFDTFLAGSAYQFLGDYAGGIQVTARNQVIRSAGEYWRVSAQVSLPYTTTGAGMPEADAFVAVGDAVLRQDLSNSTDPLKGAGQVGYRGRTVAAKLGDSLSVLDVGGAAEQHSVKDVTRVLCWGDSLTQGVGGTPYTSVLSASSSFNEILNRGVGGETSSQIKTRFDAETTSHKNTVVIWAGRNNYTDPATVLADIEGMVAQLGHSRFLVLSVLNGSYGGYEIPGGEGYALIQSINNELMARYPLNYFDMRGWLISDGLADAGITPTAQDLTDIANDTPPTSLRSDAIHLNAAGYAVVGRKVLAELYKVFRPQSAYNSIGEILSVLSGETPTKWGYKAPIQDIVASIVRVGTSLTNSGFISMSGDGNRLQFNKGLFPTANGTMDLGANSTRWKGAFFSGSVVAGALSGPVSTDFINFQNSVTIQVGTGSPEGNTTAGVGSIFINRNGGSGTVLYVKESGTGNTGWVAK